VDYKEFTDEELERQENEGLLNPSVISTTQAVEKVEEEEEVSRPTLNLSLIPKPYAIFLMQTPWLDLNLNPNHNPVPLTRTLIIGR